MRQMILAEQPNIRALFFALLDKVGSAQTIVEQLEAKGKRQKIQTKTKTQEILVINQDLFIRFVQDSDIQVTLTPDELENLKICLQLSPKFSSLFTIKLIEFMLLEVVNFPQEEWQQ